MYVRVSDRDDGWMLRYAKHDSACLFCDDDVITGERAYLRKTTTGWEVAHELCR